MVTTAITTYPARGVSKVVWGPLANAEAGAAVGVSHWADKSVQVTGVFGAGGTVVLEGSMDGATWGSVTDHTGTVISLTDSKNRVIAENPLFLRARCSAGDGTTALTVTLTAVSKVP